MLKDSSIVLRIIRRNSNDDFFGHDKEKHDK